MTSSREALTRFTDAAAASVAREIASLRREALRERELRDAQFAAKMAELEARVASVAQIERQVADRLATLKDGDPGQSVTIDMVLPSLEGSLQDLVRQSVTDTLSTWPKPKDGDSVSVEQITPLLAELAERAVSALPPVEPKEVDPELVRQLVSGAVAALPPPQPGRDADPEEIRRMVGEAIAALPPAEPGKSVTVEDVEPIIRSCVESIESAFAERADVLEQTVTSRLSEAIAAIPLPEPGKDADPEMVASLVAEKVRDAVEALPAPKQGEPGPMGSLPIVEEWQDRVYYQGEVVTRAGGIYQAVHDTGKEPGHEDWRCIVKAPKDGEPGRSFTIRGTYAAHAEYRMLDVVALNGASFAARCDEPGPCPGEGWQLIASQGKPGKPGASIKGDRGLAVTASVRAARISDDGLLTLVNADGSEVECDLYPVLSKL